MPGTIPALHILTNDVVLADPGFVRTATAVMEASGSRIAIHLRATEITPRRMFELSLELRVVSEVTRSWVLVHDRVDIALVAGVTGAQLTSRSLALSDARRIAPSLILGASVHATADAWITAQSGASFMVAGPSGDSRQEQADLALFVREVVDAAEFCPVIAIGGMTPERTHEMSRSGASGIAAMRGIWLGDAVSATHRYLAAYDEGFRR